MFKTKLLLLYYCDIIIFISLEENRNSTTKEISLIFIPPFKTKK
jgi:hypothetical protein